MLSNFRRLIFDELDTEAILNKSPGWFEVLPGVATTKEKVQPTGLLDNDSVVAEQEVSIRLKLEEEIYSTKKQTCRVY